MDGGVPHAPAARRLETEGREFRLLGPVEALAGGEPVRLGGRRQRALLALLLLEPGRAVAVDRLAEELWEGRPPAGAATTLRSYVSRLRRALGPDAVEARPPGYALAAVPAEVDAARFERLLREGREALARGAAGIAAEQLGAALALWRGPALAEVAGSGALALEARRLEALRLECVEERIEADLALGRHALLVPELERLVAREPLRERLWRQLVVALYRSGRQADALAVQRQARERLDELGLEPGAELQELERAVLRQEVAPAPATAEIRHNLPAATTSFVGRGDELDEVARLLRTQRLVTLTGLGGAGKTRLALEIGRRQAEAWRDGVWLADLAAVADGEVVADAVTAALPIADRGGDTLAGRVRDLELLLVLDNCEHLVDACAEVGEALLRGCPNLRILATSRVPLAVEGEFDYAVDPLAAGPAARLFVERASAVRRDADWPQDAVEAICRDLDGLPLAIELAAARVKALSLGDITARLDDRFRFLRAWRRVADPRHRTLETTMDWSYDLLDPAEQELLRRLSVFAGGADLDAVAAVCDGDVDELLARLVDASLVLAEAGEPTRYRLLETVRQYAAAKLADDPAAEAASRRHADHYLRLAERANLSIEAIGHGAQRPELVLAEQHNLRAALDWAATVDVELALRLALALENFWVSHAVAEGARRLEQLLARADGLDLVLRARATRDHGSCLDVLAQFDGARRQYERSRELYRQAGDELGVATLTFRLGIVVGSHDGDVPQARALFEESLEVFTRLDDPIGALQAYGCLATLEVRQGNPARARELAARSAAMAREAGWEWWTARQLSTLAELDLGSGRTADAEAAGRELVELAHAAGHRQDVVYALAILARAAAARGDRERALALWVSVEQVEDMPGRLGRFDRAAYAACMPAGPRPEPLPLDEAVALALG